MNQSRLNNFSIKKLDFFKKKKLKTQRRASLSS